MADPDLELRVGGGRGEEGGLDLLALLTFSPSVISSFFTQNNWGPGPSPRSATDLDRKRSVLSSQFASEYHRHPRALDRPLCAAGIFWTMNILSYRLVSLHVSIS